MAALIMFSVILLLILCGHTYETRNLEAELPAGFNISGRTTYYCTAVLVPLKEAYIISDVKIPIPVHNVDALFAGACRFLDHENENQYAIRNGLTWKDESGWELHDRCPRLWLPNVGSGSPLLQSQGRTGIRLGPGTGVDYLVLCSHFHDRTGQLSQFTKLVFELEPANKFPDAQDTRIADAFVDVRGGPHDFFKLNDSITFNSPAVIHPFSVHFHAHSVSHTLPHSMMLDRFVIQLERKMDGQRTLLNQTVTMGQVLNFPLPQDEYHVAVGDRILFSCSYVRNKVQYPRMESIAGSEQLYNCGIVLVYWTI